MTDTDTVIATPVGFAELVLELALYDWQADALTQFEDTSRVTKAALCTPNGAGKDTIVIAALSLWWVTVHERGRVVITSRDSRQIDEQTYPALSRHQGKFVGWKFQDRYIETANGGKIILFTTDDAGRAEGWHKEDDLTGPLLIVCNEAKSIPDKIFEAVDRCTYNAVLYASSPGLKNGRFFQACTGDIGFRVIQVGMTDCPHKSKDKIDDIIRTYGPDHPMTRSTLYGEFMDFYGEARFDFEGLKTLKADAEAFAAESTRRTAEHAQNSPYGYLTENNRVVTYIPSTERDGWVWRIEEPIPGCSYIAFCDPMTGEQSAGSKKRDGHAAGIIRLGYTDANKLWHDTEVVAALHHYDPVSKESMVRWDNDILAERLYTLALWYGDCIVIAEANNAGVEVLRLLLMAGATVWRREKRDSTRPGKKLDVMGFQTHTTTKSLLIGPVAAHIREETIRVRYMPAVEQMHQFVITDDGKGEAQPGAHDDWVIGIGLGLFALPSATVLRTAAMYRQSTYTEPHHTPRSYERLSGGAMS